MVACVQAVNGAITGIQRTYLRFDGLGKANLNPQKMALGPVGGAAVRFAQAAEVLALAEGIETALSIQQATGIVAWATLGTSNLCRVELPDCVREVIICADYDSSGLRNAVEARRRLMRSGLRVQIVAPEHGDFNDALKLELKAS